MSTTPILECKPSKWFKTRAVLILLMLAFFTAWFLKDGYSGYREKNLEYVVYQLFADKKEGKEDFVINAVEVFKEGEYTEESWKAFASKQVIPTPDADRGLLPRDYDYETKWPEEIVQGYDVLKSGKVHSLWAQYSGRKRWSIDAPEKLYDEGKIREQYYTASVCGVLFLIAAFICIRNMGRSMVVTETTYVSPDGQEVAFTAMKKIDKRKWDNKGIAMIYYEDGGSVKKAKVDGMLYGQFKEEDGAPAEALFAHIMDNFKGELVEYVSDDKDEEVEQPAEPSSDKADEEPKS